MFILLKLSQSQDKRVWFYSITLPKANYTFLISYIGFQTVSEKIELSEDKNKLQPLESGDLKKHYKY
jgi:hypothetical protein